MMDVVNLAHGAFYMLGAYVALSVVQITGSFWIATSAAPLAIAPTLHSQSSVASGAPQAGLASLIAVPVFGVQPRMDTGPRLLCSLRVVVICGLGTLSGDVAGSLLIGPPETFGKVRVQDVAL